VYQTPKTQAEAKGTREHVLETIEEVFPHLQISLSLSRSLALFLLLLLLLVLLAGDAV